MGSLVCANIFDEQMYEEDCFHGCKPGDDGVYGPEEPLVGSSCHRVCIFQALYPLSDSSRDSGVRILLLLRNELELNV